MCSWVLFVRILELLFWLVLCIAVIVIKHMYK